MLSVEQKTIKTPLFINFVALLLLFEVLGYFFPSLGGNSGEPRVVTWGRLAFLIFTVAGLATQNRWAWWTATLYTLGKVYGHLEAAFVILANLRCLPFIRFPTTVLMRNYSYFYAGDNHTLNPFFWVSLVVWVGVLIIFTRLSVLRHFGVETIRIRNAFLVFGVVVIVFESAFPWSFFLPIDHLSYLPPPQSCN